MALANDFDAYAGRSLPVRFFGRLWMAVPDPRVVLSLAIFWGLANAISALVALFIKLRTDIITPLPIMTLFFLGGAVGGPLAAWATRVVIGDRRGWPAFLVMAVMLSLFTVAVTALIFALQYRVYYAQWHEPPLTRIWVFQFVFTSASAVYQFLIFGARFYWPVAVFALPAFCLWFARRKR